ncbi:MAG: extracellular solute-binding protein [Candidatus Eremiobacteraeota bacterium]|nr:extracellular solute-binding protein [Candidatus Eremiobacteraeota bacterium]
MRLLFLLLATFTAAEQAVHPTSAPFVNVAYAGSLVTLMERLMRPAFNKGGYEFRGEAKGSVALANFIREGLRNPDVFISADPALLESLQATPDPPVKWYLPFASARLLIGYSARSRYAASLREAAQHRRSIASVLAQPGLRIGRTDPAIDPKGYRTLIVLQLAEHYYHAPGFARRVLGAANSAQLFPEETLLVRLESGDLDAAFLYSTESAPRNLPTLELPAAVNLGDTKFARSYRKVSVRIGRKTVVGTPILYALTIPEHALNKPGAIAFIRFLFSKTAKRLLQRSGLRFVYEAPRGNRNAVPKVLLSLHQ